MQIWKLIYSKSDFSILKVDCYVWAMQKWKQSLTKSVYLIFWKNTLKYFLIDKNWNIHCNLKDCSLKKLWNNGFDYCSLYKKRNNKDLY